MLLNTIGAFLLTINQPVIVHAPDYRYDKSFQAAIAGFVAANFADLSTTMYGVGKGYEEINPVYSWAQDKPITMALVKAALTTGIVYILLKDYKKNPKRTFWLTIAMTAGISYVSVRNAQTIK